MNQKLNNFTPNQRLDLLIKMCYVLGLDVIDARANWSFNPIHILKMLDADVDPIITYFEDSFPIGKNNMTYSPQRKYEIDIYDDLCVIDFLRIRSFCIKGSKLRLGNPFFHHFEIASAKSYDEALILIDLANSLKESRENILKKFKKELMWKENENENGIA